MTAPGATVQPTEADMATAEATFEAMPTNERRAYLTTYLGETIRYVAAGTAAEGTIRHGLALYLVHQDMFLAEQVAKQPTAVPA